MSRNSLEKLASIDAQLRLLVPAKLSDDDKLVEYDALLLDRFLDILQDLHGDELKETVSHLGSFLIQWFGVGFFIIIIIIIILFYWVCLDENRIEKWGAFDEILVGNVWLFFSIVMYSVVSFRETCLMGLRKEGV